MAELTRQFRIKATHPTPAGGFLAVGPRYLGELIENGAAIRFHHHGAPEWIEIVAIEHVEEAPDPRKYRPRWK
jgi:hypothetical protein